MFNKENEIIEMKNICGTDFLCVSENPESQPIIARIPPEIPIYES